MSPVAVRGEAGGSSLTWVSFEDAASAEAKAKYAAEDAGIAGVMIW